MFRKNPRLSYRTVYPYRITQSRLARAPLRLVGGAGPAVLLGGFGMSSVLLDFDAEIVGGLELDLTCAAPAKLILSYEETPEGALREEHTDPENWYQLVREEFSLEAGSHTLTSKGRRGFRFVNCQAFSEEDVTITQVRAIRGSWPVEDRGSFRCSDEKLNRIWDISAATARACMQDFYEDGVKRDGLMWIGDFRISFLTAFYVTGDAALARKCLLMMRDSAYENGAIPACSARGGGEQHFREDGIEYMPGIPGEGQNRYIIVNYMCDYIRSIEEYVRLTGDDTVLPLLLDSAEAAARHLLDKTDLNTPGVWNWDVERETADADGMTYSVMMDDYNVPSARFGSPGGFLFELLESLQTLGRLADRAGNTGCALWARGAEGRLSDHLETHYRDPRRNRYTDRTNQGASGITQYVTPRAILAGRADPLGAAAMLRSVMPNLGYSMAWRLEAEFLLGHAREALRHMTRVWGKMVDADSRTCWEQQDVPEGEATNYSYCVGSYCHGWSSSPGWQLPAWVTGVRPLADGWRSVLVAPQLADLEYAESSVPTPNGEITVRVERDGTALRLWLDLPEGVEQCTVRLPGTEDRILNGPGKYEVKV